MPMRISSPGRTWPAPCGRHEVDRVRGAAGEDHFRGVAGVDEARDRPAGAFVSIVGPAGEGVQRAAGVGVFGLVESGHGIDDRPGPERGRGGIEVDELVPVHFLGEGGEVPPPRLHIRPDGRSRASAGQHQGACGCSAERADERSPLHPVSLPCMSR